MCPHAFQGETISVFSVTRHSLLMLDQKLYIGEKPFEYYKRERAFTIKRSETSKGHLGFRCTDCEVFSCYVKYSAPVHRYWGRKYLTKMWNKETEIVAVVRSAKGLVKKRSQDSLPLSHKGDNMQTTESIKCWQNTNVSESKS